MEEKPILIMAHIVLGYPTMETSLRTVEAMVDAGVDLMELQIPFSEPIADGPVILRANHVALENGATVSACLDAAAEAASSFPIPFLIMSYCNVLFRYGVEGFVCSLAERGLRGAIVPDLPPEEGGAYFEAMHRSGLAPIVIFAPTTSLERMAHLTRFGKGFVYCVARKGVTGSHTDFSADLGAYLDRVPQGDHAPTGRRLWCGGKRARGLSEGKGGDRRGRHPIHPGHGGRRNHGGQALPARAPLRVASPPAPLPAGRTS